MAFLRANMERQPLLALLPPTTKGQESQLIDEAIEVINLLNKQKFLKPAKTHLIAGTSLLGAGFVFLVVKLFIQVSRIYAHEHETEQKLNQDWQITPAYPTYPSAPANATCPDYFAPWNATTIQAVSVDCTQAIHKNETRYEGFQDCLRIIDEFCNEQNNFQMRMLINALLMALFLVAAAVLIASIVKVKKAEKKLQANDQSSLADALSKNDLTKVMNICQKLGIVVHENVSVKTVMAALNATKTMLAEQMISPNNRQNRLTV